MKLFNKQYDRGTNNRKYKVINYVWEKFNQRFDKSREIRLHISNNKLISLPLKK